MIKIAFVIDTIEAPSAGTEKQLLLLIKKLDRTRFQPYLCVLRSSEWVEKEFDLCPYYHIGLKSFGSLNVPFRILRFVRFLKTEKIDIVHTHFRDGNIAGIIAAKIAGVKNIISSRRNQGFWHTWLELFMLRLLNRWVDRFIANSESTKKWAVSAESIDPDRINVIYNALELEQYYRSPDSERTAFRKGLSFPPDAKVVGIVANLRPIKSIDTFILAAAEVIKRDPAARFLIIGEGGERKRLEQLCSELDISEFVNFLGRRLDIPYILSVIDVGILSSSSESLSNSILEYLASGLPVVCTDVGGAREVIEDGVNGYVVDAGDYKTMSEKINIVLQSEIAMQMGQKSREKVNLLFTETKIINSYQSFYQKAIHEIS
ncbi:MAG: glycosyltransferase [Dissulfurispiraceae bacterium]|jgi:glycosyltransferase involved in cell wall biosynthesis|nr:glycosyltransferase [Dissulfurispiraceae bacterium]